MDFEKYSFGQQVLSAQGMSIQLRLLQGLKKENPTKTVF